jgi:hypothetical protein
MIRVSSVAAALVLFAAATPGFATGYDGYSTAAQHQNGRSAASTATGGFRQFAGGYGYGYGGYGGYGYRRCYYRCY